MTSDIKRMRLRYAGICGCGAAVAAGAMAGYDRVAKRAVCPACLAVEPVVVREQAAAAEVDPVMEVVAHVEAGLAGGSARAEFERRSARREEKVRAAHPKLGGLLLRLNAEPQSTRAWQSGAVGEEKFGARLDGLVGDGILGLHDRRIPGSKANIDHLAVGPSGIFVIDAKHYVDAKIEVRRSGGWRSPVTEHLFVGGRDKTKLVVGMASQVAAVYEALGDQFDGVIVQPVLAFVDGSFPVFGTLEVAGVPILGPRGTAKLVRRPGPLDADSRARLHAHLASRLPAYKVGG